MTGLGSEGDRYGARVLSIAVVTLMTVCRAPAAEDVLKFFNGDRLHGGLVAVSPTNGLLWHRDDAAADIRFALENVQDVVVAGRDAQGGEGGSAVLLTNGDKLLGRIVGLDEQVLRLSTPEAGPLEIRRPMIAAIKPGHRSSNVIYEGPTGLDGWTMQDPACFEYKNDAIYVLRQVTIGRLVKFPDSFSVELDIEWRGPYPDCQMVIGGETVESYPSRGYGVRMYGSSIRLYRNGSSSGLPSQSYSFDGKRRAHVRICMNKQARSIAVLIDGVVAAQWTDPGDFAVNGDGLVFYAQQAPLRINRIRVTEWDGELPSPAVQASGAAKEDTVDLVNGDRFTGEARGIVDGTLRLATSYAEMEVPLNRVVRVVFSAEAAERARRNRYDVRARFRSGALMTVNLLSLAEGVVRGGSENFGEAEFKLRDAKLVEFNIYNDRVNNDGGTW